MLVIALLNEWYMEVVDIETVFLYGVLDEETNMKMSEGLETYMNSSFQEDECLILDKVIYGQVQAARQFNRRRTEVMEKKMGFKKCTADKCLLMRKTSQGTVVVCVYIDDTLCAGDKGAIREFKDDIKNYCCKRRR